MSTVTTGAPGPTRVALKPEIVMLFTPAVSFLPTGGVIGLPVIAKDAGAAETFRPTGSLVGEPVIA